MKLLGLTGGVGMGKSTAAEILAGLSVPVIDTDQIARDVVQPGQPALDEVKARFGPGIVGDDGRLRRGELARLVFADEKARRDLEAILHPRIREAWLRQVELWRAGMKPVGAVVIPLLFETAAEKQFDRIVCVACTARTQSERLNQRGWTGEEARARIAAQWPVEKKMTLSDRVIWTEGTVDIHREQWKRVLT
jgi:dephospho-CoA kinase